MKKRSENSFSTVVYCKENDVNVKKELEYLNFLFLNHDLTVIGYCLFGVKEIISLWRHYFSTYIFSSRKQ